jgi:hypothetical protein
MKLEEIVNNFNLQLEELFNIIENIYTDENIKRYKLMVKTVIKLNAIKLIEQYIIHAVPFAEHIYKKDESFFINQTVDDVREKIGQTKLRKELHENSVVEVLKLKNIWSIVDNDIKDIVWEYFQLLTFYAQEYFKLKYGIKN